MRTERQTSKHLLLAVIVTVFSVMLVMMTLTMAWEPWMVPLIIAGMFKCSSHWKKWFRDIV